MFYIIQENLFKEVHYDLLIGLMNKHNFDFEIVKFRPFIHEVEFKTDRKDVFCFGAVAMAHSAEKYGWTSGSMMNENHDLEVYGKHYGEYMLNHKGKIINFGDELPFDDYLFFARPTKDTKIFSGQVFTKHSWKEYVEECSKNDVKDALQLTKVLVSSLIDIQQEIRCWIVDGKVVTASRYKLGDRVVYKNYDDETFYTDFAQKIVDIYQPAKTFVLDICLADDELKVVEINCINCAGFYDANMEKLIMALEKTKWTSQ